MDHIGIDVHKKDSQICILTEAGELLERRVRTEPDRFAEVLGHRSRARILIESATESEWVARCLEALGHEVIVADPNFAPMYAQRTRKVKTDRRDARALAEACLLGAYRRAHRLSDEQRHVRARLTVRDALVRTRTGYIAVIRSLLRQHGWRVRSGAADSFSCRVRELPLPGRLLSEIAPLLAVMRHVNHQLAYSDERIETVTRTDARVRRLRTVPNVGPVTAAAFVAAIDDVTRFRGAHEVEAYLGLVPRELSSESAHRRAPPLGHPDRRPPRQEGGRRRVGPTLGRDSVRAPARWDHVPAPPREWPLQRGDGLPSSGLANRTRPVVVSSSERILAELRCGGSACRVLAAVREPERRWRPTTPRLPSCAGGQSSRRQTARTEG